MAMARHAITVLVAAATLALAACGDDEQATATQEPEGGGEVEAFVEAFMKARQAGLPADEFLSSEAKRAYDRHKTGLWLYDDTLPGGPGGEYARFSIDELRQFSVDTNLSWQAFVRIRVQWDGDASASEVVEVLTIDSGPADKLLVVEARRTDDPADDGLPLAVAETRQKIYRAGVAQDYEALRSLLDPETFNYSLGEEGDPIGYWQRQEKAEIPILGDILSGVLHTRFGKNEDIFTWPSATSKLPQDWTEADIESMREAGYTDRDIRTFREQIGGYAGWRVGIRADGTWLYFISGE
jgi:hypothetical protein